MAQGVGRLWPGIEVRVFWFWWRSVPWDDVVEVLPWRSAGRRLVVVVNRLTWFHRVYGMMYGETVNLAFLISEGIYGYQELLRTTRLHASLEVQKGLTERPALCYNPAWVYQARRTKGGITMSVNLREHIEVDPEVMLGKPVIRGTRIPVELIVRKLGEGATEADLLDAYPRLTQQDIRAALAYAADSLEHETIILEAA